MKKGNTTLIPQNIAPSYAESLAIFNGNTKICDVDISNMQPKNLGTKKYTCGLLSDTHTMTYGDTATDSQDDLTRAIGYLSNVAEITCICGDLANEGDDGGLEKHKEIVNANKGNMLMLEIAGNHEHRSMYGGEVPMSDSTIKQYTGYPLYYTVSNQPTDEEKRNYYSEIVGEDVFIMCGNIAYYSCFNEASLQWLYETLEANRNKRCFLFVHPPIYDAQHCGDALGIITWDGMGSRVNNSYKDRFVALLQHYKNVIYFHGHTHAMLEMQDYLQGLANPLPANYDFTDGVHSVHIPSMAISRDISSGESIHMLATSQGYLMEVYQNHVVLKGIDFVTSKFIPIAHYCLDTTLQTIAPNTFTDSTGTIKT